MSDPHYIVVGTGWAGATFAHRVAKHGKRCLLVEKRSHIGGNAYTERKNGIDIHKYGLHAFHTNNKEIWDFVTQFGEFNNYHHLVRAHWEGKVYPLPINLTTFQMLWGAVAPGQAREMVEDRVVTRPGPFEDFGSIEQWCLRHIGPELYNIFVRGYTTKQWNRNPNELPESIIRRLPVRYTYKEGYFDDLYQGIPVDGYTEIFARMLEGMDVIYDIDFIKERSTLKQLYPTSKIVYTGPIDDLYHGDLGRLEYRSLRFDHQYLRDEEDYQGVAQMNYLSEDVPFTRIIEHKHMNLREDQRGTWITREYPQSFTGSNEPYYPVGTHEMNALANRYIERAKNDEVIPLGRLATYRYWNMDQVIAQALSVADRVLRHA